MSRRNRHSQSETAQAEAARIARGTQQPGQTKEQTRLIAKGIQKGIEQYKQQQNAKARELDRRLKQSRQQASAPAPDSAEVQPRVVYRQHWLPWLLLVLSWLALVGLWVTCN